MLRTATAALVMLTAGAAAGQTLTLSVLSSVDGGASWHGSVEALPGSTVQVGIWMQADGMYGAGGATLRLTASGALASDSAGFAAGTATGRVTPFAFGQATNAIYRDSPSSFRIDAAADAANANTAAGMTFFQRDPVHAGEAFSRANPALCFRFDVNIGADGSARTIVMAMDQLSRGQAGFYASAQATRVTLTRSVNLTGGTINVNIPGPGAPLIAGLMGLAALRRRRGG